MNAEQQKALLSIALLAAFADGTNDDREREQIRVIAESLGGAEGAGHLRGLYQQVLLKQIGLVDAAAALGEPAHRQLAYEMAVCVCDADGATSAAERRFLDDLLAVLGLERGAATATADEVEALASADPAASPAAHVPGMPEQDAAQPQSVQEASRDVELDRSILNYSILNGALELLPQSWASMAIIPLQIRMVYSIGRAHGYELDQGHIRELLATMGVGMTSQYLEQFGRKLLGGLFGKVGGGLGKQLGKSATSVAFSFATTYALGQVARRYYGGGRQMSTELLRDTFRNLLEPAKEMQARYLPEIRQRAGTLDAGQIMSMVRGG